MIWTCDEENDGDWVKKCMDIRVNGKMSVEEQKKTWLEQVELEL